MLLDSYYFVDNATYTAKNIRRWFKMNKELFIRIMFSGSEYETTSCARKIAPDYGASHRLEMHGCPAVYCIWRHGARPYALDVYNCLLETTHFITYTCFALQCIVYRAPPVLRGLHLWREPLRLLQIRGLIFLNVRKQVGRMSSGHLVWYYIILLLFSILLLPDTP
jgi:hypothetical protein